MRRPSPLVSVVLPTYNRARLLGQAVESVVGQTYRNLELIVVDDGSTDDTPSYLASLTDSRLTILRRSHTGNTAAVRNAGIEAARGEWIAFLDSDDCWLATKLETQLRRLLAAPDHRWSYTGFSLVDETGQPLPPAPARGSAGAVAARSSSSVQKRLLAYAVAAPLPSLVVERKLLDEAGGLDVELYHDDFDLVLRLAAAASGLSVPEPLLLIRKDRARPWTVRDSLCHHQQMDAVLAKHLRLAASPSLRALCRAQRAYHLFLVARARAGLGSYRRAATDAISSLLRAPNLLYLWAFRRSVRRDVSQRSSSTLAHRA